LTILLFLGLKPFQAPIRLGPPLTGKPLDRGALPLTRPRAPSYLP